MVPPTLALAAVLSLPLSVRAAPADLAVVDSIGAGAGVPPHALGVLPPLEDAPRLPERRCGRCPVRIRIAYPSDAPGYPLVQITGDGFRGTLVSPNTRIDGLVSRDDVLRQARGEDVLDWQRAEPEALRRTNFYVLDLARPWARAIAGLGALALGALALFLRSRSLGRAALLAMPLALAASLVLSAVGEESRGWVAGVTVAAVAAAVPLGAVLTGRRLALAVGGALGLFLVVLVAWPEVPALAAIGPEPDRGGRFYGVTNRTETIMLAPLLVAGALLPQVGLAALAALAVITVGWSKAGADGGGILVLAAGFATLAWRGGALRGRTALLAAGAGVAALVAADLLFGESHVTESVASGDVFGDWTERLERSAEIAFDTVARGALWLAVAGATLAVTLAPPRSAVRDALGVALAVSLLANDAPMDVVLYGGAAMLGLWAWERARGSPLAPVR